MAIETRQTIIEYTKTIFARNGYEGFSMRILAKESGVSLSSIYHFFKDKDEILKFVFDQISRELGEKRKKLKTTNELKDMLEQRIRFQFSNIEEVVFVLKYYLHFRERFELNEQGYVPHKAYLHIEEVLDSARQTGQIHLDDDDLQKEAKIITHAINGFLLEYYPDLPKKKELDALTSSLAHFITRSLTNKEVHMV